jgi:hypothetical protein
MNIEKPGIDVRNSSGENCIQFTAIRQVRALKITLFRKNAYMIIIGFLFSSVVQGWLKNS